MCFTAYLLSDINRTYEFVRETYLLVVGLVGEPGWLVGWFAYWLQAHKNAWICGQQIPLIAFLQATWQQQTTAASGDRVVFRRLAYSSPLYGFRISRPESSCLNAGRREHASSFKQTPKPLHDRSTGQIHHKYQALAQAWPSFAPTAISSKSPIPKRTCAFGHKSPPPDVLIYPARRPAVFIGASLKPKLRWTSSRLRARISEKKEKAHDIDEVTKQAANAICSHPCVCVSLSLPLYMGS